MSSDVILMKGRQRLLMLLLLVSYSVRIHMPVIIYSSTFESVLTTHIFV